MEVIRSIEYIRGKKLITFESGWKVWLKKDAELPFQLTEGSEIDRKDFEKAVLLCQYPDALNRAVAFLAVRSRSRKEIEDRLKAFRYDQSTIDLVLFRLEKESLIDDEAFSREWACSRIQKYGPGRIEQELRMKGMDGKEIREAMVSITEEDTLETAVRLAARKILSMRSVSDDRILFRRVTDMLIRRGFPWETARKAFELAKKETDR